MPVLVDSNVLLDIVCDDPVWADWSVAKVTENQHHGLWVNPVIYAELCVGAESSSEVDGVLIQLNLRYHEFSSEALYLAAKAFLRYRRSGGSKTSPLPDFFIGAQAQTLGLTLLTRDANRFRTYFPQVTLICP